MITGQRVIDEARSWLGTPFRHQGRDRSGIDCVGLPIVVLRDLQCVPPDADITNYGRLPSDELIARIIKYCTPLERPQTGALVAISWDKLTAHVALCTPDNLIHSYQTIGHVVEHGYRGHWLRVTRSVWALPGVVYE